MSTATRADQVETADGAMGAYVALPSSGSGPGMVLIHEILGVNDYVRGAAQRLADIGYVVLAPDLFWRTQPGLDLPNDDEGMKAGMAAAQQLDFAAATGDAIAALAALREMPEVTGAKAGVIGFCLGGSLAWNVAAGGDPDVAVVYYGSAIPDALDAAERITCPMIMHWGGADPLIKRDQVDAVAAMAATRDNIECHVHEGAGHAFDNNCSERFHVPEARAAAWELTAAFLARELPVG
ncbi:MAG: carboxymethylenebutenolidase [Solirubrobacteraceae bacterium]|jgi:carboxymethylenebutenolidase|nr:carboxymethylenebutenolidase [Solirubrobacteraceae bacterium]